MQGCIWICRNIEAVITRRSWKPLGQKPRGFESLFLRQKLKHQSLRLVLLFLLRYERILTPLCESCARRMGFAFERKPSVSSLTSGGAKNLRQRWIPLFLRHISNSRLIQSYRPAVFFLSLKISRRSLIYKGFFAFVVHFGVGDINIPCLGNLKI